MPHTYQGLGISLLYPETWKLEEDPESDSVTLETPSGAFLTLSRSDDLEADFARVKKTMESEYEEVESESYHALLAEQTFTGITQRFVFLDLIIVSHLLKFDLRGTSYVVQIQGEDREVEDLQPVFNAILTSACQSL